MATTTGRDGGIPGSGGPGSTAANKEEKGLAGAGAIDAVPPSDPVPSKKAMAAGRGDVERNAPNQPITAAKQQMEEDRGQAFTSASGRPTQG